MALSGFSAKKLFVSFSLYSSFKALLSCSVIILVLIQSVLSAPQADQDSDILDYLPAVLSAARSFKSCDDGVYANCTNLIGCRAIDGIFDGSVCRAKTRGQSLAEQLTGSWEAKTSLPDGDHHGKLTFRAETLTKLRADTDFLLKGDSSLTESLDDTLPNPILASFDSARNDWYMLDFWGTDIGRISIYEVAQTSKNQFDGCEYSLTYPDLRYLDGVCQPLRLRRVGVQPRTVRVLSNIVKDFSVYLASIFQPETTMQVGQSIQNSRRTVNNIGTLLSLKTPQRTPVRITQPVNFSSTNQNFVTVSGLVDPTINLDRVTLNGVQIANNAGNFTGDIETTDDSNKITVVADYGRRSYTAEVLFDVDKTLPSVVSAASTSSTSVLLQFSESMASQIVDKTDHFNIVRKDGAGALPVTEASFTDTENTTVLLYTGLQNSTTYTITAVGVLDAAGNAISPPVPVVVFNPAARDFVGTAPSGDEIVDTDEDGVLDHVELSGWPVVITRTDGTITTEYVSADPFLADTDGDGLSDGEELHAGTNPRNVDTDGDTLSDNDEWNRIYSNPLNQDTDGDSIQDGFEYLFFKTSPILADTDGDKLSDPDEVAAGNRNPLVADLPSPNITVGNVALQLDTRFSFVDENGQTVSNQKTVETTLSQGSDETFSRANEASTKNTINRSIEISAEVTQEAGFGAKGPTGKTSYTVGTSIRGEQGSERGSTVSFGSQSSRNSEEAYHDSLSEQESLNSRQSVTREVVGASVRVDLEIENVGDIPFSISNLELTAQKQDPVDRRRMVPVASLTPQNGSLSSINVGALGDPSRGPFVFDTDEVFPQEVEELMKNPRGLIIQLANFDIVDEQGNNFAFSSQQILDRTAGISFDFGNGQTESYRVATASDHNPDTGIPAGISMAEALRIIGLQRYPTIRDGGNGIVETELEGDSDDVAEQQLGRPIEPQAVIINAGDDGLISATPGGDDVLFAPDYITESFAPASAIIDGGNGFAETFAAGDDIQDAIVPGLPSPDSRIEPGQVVILSGDNRVIESVPGGDDILVPAGKAREVLVEYNGVSASDNERRFWVLFSDTEVDGVDLNKIRLRSGQQYDFAFVQDRDNDRVYAREEYLHGSSDLKSNTDACAFVTSDTNCDSLSDFEEINEGWLVQLKTSPQSYQVYSNPNQGDSDRDGLPDDLERECGLDPRQRDTDLDGLTDREEILGIRINGLDESVMQSVNLDSATINPFAVPRYGFTPPSTENLPSDYALVVLEDVSRWADHNQPLNANGCFAALAERFPLVAGEGFATDPLNADTDGDFISDLNELRLGLHPNNPDDGASFLDDDGDGLPNALENNGWRVFVNGDTVGEVVNSNSFKTDTDSDRLPDLLEYYLKSNPNNNDTDGDGVLDTDEYRNGGDTCIGLPSSPCGTFLGLAEDDYNEFVTACTLAPVCDVAQIEGSGIFGLGNSDQRGTNLNESDTDGDGLSDFDEIQSRLISVVLSGDSSSKDISVTSDPRKSDTDDDGVNDSEEDTKQTNPENPDTDSDGASDRAEIDDSNLDFVARRRNPKVAEKSVKLQIKQIYLDARDSNNFLRGSIYVRTSQNGDFGFLNNGMDQVTCAYKEEGSETSDFKDNTIPNGPVTPPSALNNCVAFDAVFAENAPNTTMTLSVLAFNAYPKINLFGVRELRTEADIADDFIMARRDPQQEGFESLNNNKFDLCDDKEQGQGIYRGTGVFEITVSLDLENGEEVIRRYENDGGGCDGDNLDFSIILEVEIE